MLGLVAASVPESSDVPQAVCVPRCSLIKLILFF